MSNQPLKTLAITAGHDRICCVFALGEQPMDWQMSFKAVKIKQATRAKVIEWIDYYRPDIVLTPTFTNTSRKGHPTKGLIEIARKAAEDSAAQLIEMQPAQPYENKYQHIEYLCEKYPQLKSISVKTRRYWEKENPRVSYFEVVGMIKGMVCGPI